MKILVWMFWCGCFSALPLAGSKLREISALHAVCGVNFCESMWHSESFTNMHRKFHDTLGRKTRREIITPHLCRIVALRLFVSAPWVPIASDGTASDANTLSSSWKGLEKGKFAMRAV